MKTFIRVFFVFGVGLLAITSQQFVYADSTPKYEVGIRADGNLSGGEPANDILGASIIGRYRINKNWLTGFAIEVAEFDFEQPYKSLNMDSTEVIDSTTSSNMFSVWAERRYNESQRGAYWFWTAGIGINSLDADDIAGITKDGAAFFYKTEIDDEVVLTVTAGRRHNLSKNWSLGYGIRLEHRSGDWTILDRETGVEEVVIDSYNVHGAFLSTSFRF